MSDDGASDEGDQDRGLLGHVMDVCVHLPLGAAMELPGAIPRCIDRGREEIGRLVSSLPLPGGAGRRVEKAQAQARATMRGLGLVRSGANGNDSSAAPRGFDSPGSAATEAPPARPTRPDPGIDPATLAIPDYDSLSASQVVPRLESLATDELEAVRQYESAARGRKTILNKIAQIQGR